MADTSLANYFNIAPSSTTWGLGQNALVQALPLLMQSRGTPNQQFGTALGMSLVSALLGYQARRSAAEQSLQAAEIGSQLIGMQTPQERLALIKGVDSSNVQQNLLGLNARIGEQELQNQLIQRQKVGELTANAEFAFGDLGTKLFERELEKLREQQTIRGSALRGLGSGRKGRGSVAEGTVAKPFNITDPETLAGRRDTLIQRGIEMGMTPNQALAYAEKNLATDTVSNKLATKRIEDARKRADAFDEVTSVARAGVEGAGITGGALGGLRQTGSRLAAIFSPEQQAKQDAVKLLDSVKPDVVKLNRSPGAVTDFESRMLIGAGPSSLNTPSENEKIISKMEVVSDLEQEYADFLEAYITQKGSAVGADSLWVKYKEQEVFKNGKYNENRVPIFDYQTRIKEGNSANTISPAEQKLLNAGFVRGPSGGWIKP